MIEKLALFGNSSRVRFLILGKLTLIALADSVKSAEDGVWTNLRSLLLLL